MPSSRDVAAVAGGDVNWFPGYYSLATLGASAAEKQAIVDDPDTAPFHGMQFRYLWNDSELSEGDYSAGTAELDADLARCATAGKKLMVMLQYKTFDSTNAVPAYMLGDSKYSSSNQSWTAEIVFGGDTHLAMIWLPAVNLRLQAWIRAMVDHIKASPHVGLVAGIVFNETSLGSIPDLQVLQDADYDPFAYMAAIQSNLLTVTSRSSRLVAMYYHEGGFIDPNDGSPVGANGIMGDWLIEQARVGAGTPDAEGLNPHGSNYVLRDPAYQGLIASIPNIQANDYGTDRNASLQGAWDYMALPDPTGLRGHFLVFSYADAPASAPNAFDYPEVAAFIPGNPVPNTAMPAGW